MKTKLFILSFILFFQGEIFAHRGIATDVMEEIADIHKQIYEEKSDKINTARLLEFLQEAAFGKKDVKKFKAAIPVAKKLGEATTLADKRKYFAEISNILADVVGHHDKSGVNLFYCSKMKKKWIAKGDQIENPYGQEMKTCGEKIE